MRFPYRTFTFWVLFLIQNTSSLAAPLMPSSFQCLAKNCVDLDGAISSALTHGFTKREEYETLLQSRSRVLVALGLLLPRISISVSSMQAPLSPLSLLSNLFGILIPSNWFNFAESKLIYQAEKNSYLAISRNTILDTQTLYYKMHKTLSDRAIYTYYANNLQGLIESFPVNSIVANNSLLLANTMEDLRSSAQIVQFITPNLYPYDLAVAIGQPQLSDISITPLELPDLDQISPLEVNAEDLTRVKEQSKELLALRYLKRSTHYNRLSRIFSFFGVRATPTDSTSETFSFGLDILANVALAGSQNQMLAIKIQEMENKLEANYRERVQDINMAIALYHQYAQALRNNQSLFSSALVSLNSFTSEDLVKFQRSLEFTIKFALSLNSVQHSYLVAKGQLDKLLGQGKWYTNNQISVPERKPLHPIRDHLKRKEYDEIDEDLKKGVLDLENP